MTIEVLETMIPKILYYKPYKMVEPYFLECVNSFPDQASFQAIVPEILSYFEYDLVEHLYTLFYKMTSDSRYEDTALSYLSKHEIQGENAQKVLYGLLNYYFKGEYEKPEKWCDLIAEKETLYCDMYYLAAKYYGMVGEYDKADNLIDRALAMCINENLERFLYRTAIELASSLKELKEKNQKYRNGKPFWPKTEERKKALAKIYDEKGIKYGRVEKKPNKVSEKDFKPIQECFDDDFENYCAFWCAGISNNKGIKSIYQIAAVKVRNGKIVDTFQSLIRPLDGGVQKERAAKESGISLEVISGADPVDMVLPKFFAFVEDDILVSTGALGEQAKMISRAARYAFMTEIKNEFYDLLDLASDVSSDFDLEHNTRKYLLEYFSIPEGKDALEKAQINQRLYVQLKQQEG